LVLINEIIATVRNFADKEMNLTLAEEWDKNEQLAPSIFKRFGELGILGITVSEEFGGVGLKASEMAAVMEELSYSCPATCLSYLAHSILFVHNLANNGSKQQLEKYLPRCISGEWIAGMGMTEPSAGSDALGMKTTAQRDGNFYILNGAKAFITNAPVGDVFLVYARTGSQQRDLSTFIVEKNFPGLKIGKKISKMGMRASPTGELVFENCRVPLENRVGEEGACVTHLMKNLDIERVGLAAMSLGIARACLEHSLKYTKEREQFAKPIIQFQSISDKIANMYIGYRTAKAFVKESCQVIESGHRANQEAAAAKIYASETATKIALDAIQVMGGYGYTREFPVERLMRDAKLLEIGGGTSEILRGIIVKEFIRNNTTAASVHSNKEHHNSEYSATQ